LKLDERNKKVIIMPDEHMCKWCKRYDTCLERKRVEKEGDIVIDCELFEEIDDFSGI